jgi:hypothetical protein
MRYVLVLVIVLLLSVDSMAEPYWLVSGGSNGVADRSSIGIEAGGTRVIMDKIPLSAELSMNFNFGDVPSETRFTTNPGNESYTVQRIKEGPEIGYLFKSGINLDEMITNLTLQAGIGYALQTVMPVATGTVSGKHWQQGSEYTDVYLVGYGGLLYRVKNIAFSAGYNNRRGIVAGIGSSW